MKRLKVMKDVRTIDKDTTIFYQISEIEFRLRPYTKLRIQKWKLFLIVEEATVSTMQVINGIN